MKKVMVGILFLVMLAGFTGCGTNTYSGKRFQVIYEQGSGFSYICIYKDTETGHKYLWKKTGYAGGLCELDEE